jgi:hypothetical protein
VAIDELLAHRLAKGPPLWGPGIGLPGPVQYTYGC